MSDEAASAVHPFQLSSMNCAQSSAPVPVGSGGTRWLPGWMGFSPFIRSRELESRLPKCRWTIVPTGPLPSIRDVAPTSFGSYLVRAAG